MVNGQWYDIYGTIKSRGLLKAKLRPILMINRDTKEGLVREGLEDMIYQDVGFSKNKLENLKSIEFTE